MEKAHDWEFVRSKNNGNNKNKTIPDAENSKIQNNHEVVWDEDRGPLGHQDDLVDFRPFKDENLFTKMSTANSQKPTERSKALRSHLTQEPQAIFSNTYERAVRNGRKALRVIIKGVEHFACPDSGSDKNVLSEAFAKEHKIRLRCGKNDKRRFELGNGTIIESIGRAHFPCSIAKGTFSKAKQWFHVIADCAVPLIIGRLFLETAQVLTKNRHYLERCPPEFGQICSLKFIGTPRKRSGIGVSMNHRLLVAILDTGSDLNLISQACAERERFYIDKSKHGQVRLENADGSETKTVGRVYVPSISLDLRMARHSAFDGEGERNEDASSIIDKRQEFTEAPAGEVFYVVKGLPCDVILGDDFLERTDAFNVGTPKKRRGCLWLEDLQVAWTVSIATQ